MGGQAFGWFDRDLANSAESEYEWQKMNIINVLSRLGFIQGISEEDATSIEALQLPPNPDLDDLCNLIYAERNVQDSNYRKIEKRYKEIFNGLEESLKVRIESLAWENTEIETLQAMEATVHNLNSMHSRAGAQVPFSSVNIGTDESKFARLVAKCLLLAYEKGLGKGEQPLFPNICFKVKSGVNYEPDTPNFDLLLLALRVSSKRLFPTFNFQDSTINKDFPEDVPTMGCRTMVNWNRHGGDHQTCERRGNLSFTTVNLPNTAMECKYGNVRINNLDSEFEDLKKSYKLKIPQEYKDNVIVKEFFIRLNQNVDAAILQLVARFKYQCTFRKSDFPFLMSGSWMDSEKLGKNDDLYEVLKHGTLGIGLIGLAETLKCLVSKHHGEDENANQLGREIVRFMAEKADRAADRYNLNFAVIATPAEGLAGKLVARDKKIYGIIEGVTDKEWYTNSFHVPVEYDIDIFEKIKIEGKYSKYARGGSICYVELSESPLGNIDAYYKIIQTMYEEDVVYGAINFPCNRCRNCGQFGVLEETCPVCGSDDISRIIRITGYLAEDENFNAAKRAEARNRKVHLKIKK